MPPQNTTSPILVLSFVTELIKRSMYKGIASRELTRSEADIVKSNLNEIWKRYSRMRKDDVLTMKEVEKLDRMLDENSKMIYRGKHNRKFNIRRLF